MKYIFIALALISSNTLAECIGDDELSGLKPEIIFTKGEANPNSMHLPMGEVKIILPSSYLGLNIEALRITQGEVAEFYIPLEFNISNNVAQSIIHGYKSSMKNFELEVTYSKGFCTKSMQTMLLYSH